MMLSIHESVAEAERLVKNHYHHHPPLFDLSKCSSGARRQGMFVLRGGGGPWLTRL